MASKEARQRERELAYLRRIAAEARQAVPPPAPVDKDLRELELGGAAVGLRARGFEWEEIADGLRRDVETVRRCAARFILWRDRQA